MSLQDKLFWDKTDLISLQIDSSSFANIHLPEESLSLIDCSSKVNYHIKFKMAFHIRDSIANKEQEKLYALYCDTYSILKQRIQTGTFSEVDFIRYEILQSILERYTLLDTQIKERAYVLTNTIT
jgi:hypothetical protein